jgi:transcriptional regulator of heat shock response
MNQRAERILESAIREFIRTGEPVSSHVLFDRYDFGIKPAMIRFELGELTRGGFLEQPHHSAGRVPSDRGYQFFVERELHRVEPAQDVTVSLRDSFTNGHWPDFVEELSRDLGTFGVLWRMHENIYKEGLERLMKHLEWDTRAELMGVIDDCERIGERINDSGKMFNKMENFLEVFIGRSPFTKSDKLSVIAGDYETNDGRMFLFAIGPKRMNYEKTAKVFKGLKKVAKKKSSKEYGRG